MKKFVFLLAGLESELTFRDKPSPLPLQEITNFEPDARLSEFEVLADEEYNIGAAWYCRDKISRAVFRVSPEYGDSAEFVNSSTEAFTASITAAVRWSEEYDSKAVRKNPRVIEILAASLKEIDNKAFDSEKNQWPMLIEHMAHSVADDDEMEFTFETE